MHRSNINILSTAYELLVVVRLLDSATQLQGLSRAWQLLLIWSKIYRILAQNLSLHEQISPSCTLLYCNSYPQNLEPRRKGARLVVVLHTARKLCATFVGNT